jgi:simple sugar transport system substrate-binding protein
MHEFFSRNLRAAFGLGVCALAALLAPPVANAAPDDKISIIMLAGPLWDPFFGAMKKGADDAAKDLGVSYQWVTGTDPNNFLADYAKLVKQSATRKPSALVIGNYFPDTLDPIIKQITAEGIPVIIQHDGGASWKEDGAVGYVGFSAHELGKTVGEMEVKAGAKHGLCVNHVPGNKTLELDCAGFDDAFKAAGGTSKTLMIQFSDASNPTFVTQAIKGALQADPLIDAVWTIGAAQAVDSVAAIDQLGGSRKIVNGSLGLSLGSLSALKDGKLLFIADLQPYLDGYYGLLAAYQYAKYRMLPLGQISTGPLMLDKDNVDEVLRINKTYPGVRGAS